MRVEPQLNVGNDFVLVARTAIVDCDFERLLRDIIKVFKRADLFKENL